MSLSKTQIGRYSRQLILPELGVRGQQRLLDASVLVVGAGGLGCPAALYLAAAGVGRLGILDSETVELSNLHRQILHATQDLGRAKADSARARLLALNPDVTVIPLHERLDARNAKRIVAAYDLVVDGADNFPTRYLVNDACVLLGKPFVHAAVVHHDGQLMSILPGRSACYRCVFPEPPAPGSVPSCQEAGVVGAVAGVVGCLAAYEALKIVAGFGAPMADRLLVFRGLAGGFREVALRRDRGCAVCGEHPTITEPVDYALACAAAAGV